MGREVSVTVAAEAASGVVMAEEGCTTPTAAECRIPKVLDCPPAPRKPRKAVACTAQPACAKGKEFFVPPNLDAVFAVRRAY